MFINTNILILKWLWVSLRSKIESTLEKPKGKTPSLRGDLIEKLGLGSLVRFLANSNTLSTLELNQIQTHKNPTACAEVERQQSNGLIYANIVRFR